MKKILAWAMFIIIIMTATESFAQMTRADQKKSDDLNIKIGNCGAEIAHLNSYILNVKERTPEIVVLQAEIDTLNKYQPETKTGIASKKELLSDKNVQLRELKQKQLNYILAAQTKKDIEFLKLKKGKYELEQQNIFDQYISSTKIPAQISRRDKKLRNYSVEARTTDLAISSAERQENTEAIREEMGIKKMLKSSVKADSVKGYEGFVHNLSTYSRINFIIYSINAQGRILPVETVSFFTGPGEKIPYNLIPGAYRCDAYLEGQKIGEWTFAVTPQSNYILGVWTHWGVYREGI